MEAKLKTRDNYLDWLRVLGILLVFIYHSSRFYNVEDWLVKNEVWYPAVELWNSFSTSFMMPLMFAISGASLFYAIGKGGFGKFFKDKVLRLLVPLLVGIFTHAALQAYLGARSHGLFAGSFFQFLPHYYRLDSIAWEGMHLWYLLYLFIFSVALYPLMRWLKGRGRGFLVRLDDFISKTAILYLLMLPIMFLYFIFDGDSVMMRENGGYPYIIYAWIVLLGFLIVSDERVKDKIRRVRWLSLALGMAMVVASVILISQIDNTDELTLPVILAGLLRHFGGWISVLAFFGLAMQYLTMRNSRLDYANEAVLPFYILHQTVLVSVGYFVLGWGLPEVLEWAAIVVISFGLIMVIYEYLVRRWNPMRFLFGMKLLKKD